MRRNRVLAVLLLLLSLAGCPSATTPPVARSLHPEKLDRPGLHNVYRVTERLYSGSSPEGDEGFRSLRDLGIETILSVDGARPDVEMARKYGLRYVHLPIGYDAVPEEQGLRIARAVRDLPGAVYVHCHHGKHRGPAAVGYACRCLGECDDAGAAQWLQLAGTDPRYEGLYGSVKAARRTSTTTLDGIDNNFPETARVGLLAEVMVRMDGHEERLKHCRAAGWKAPPSHPDVAPAHEALQLLEQYRELRRLLDMQDRPGEFRRWLDEGETAAADLERALRAGKPADDAFRRSAAACAGCHARFRDRPQR